MSSLWPKALLAAGLLVVAIGAAILVVGPTTLKRWAYEEPGRDRWQQPERVIEALAIEPSSVVADVGSGGGYFAFRLADAVGAGGLVLAADLDEGLNEYVAREALERGLGNLTVVHAGHDSPNLTQPVDLLFTCNTVHHFPDIAGYFENVKSSLTPGGRLAIIDYRDKHRSLPEPELIVELESAGFVLDQRFDFLEKQYFLVFRVRS